MLSDDKIRELLKVEYECGKYNCYWLVKEVSKEVGIELPNYDGPEDNTLLRQVIDGSYIQFEELEKPEPYCVVLFRFRLPIVTHIGIVMEDCQRFMHLLQRRNVAIERLDHPLWSKKIKGYYRWNKKS